MEIHEHDARIKGTNRREYWERELNKYEPIYIIYNV